MPWRAFYTRVGGLAVWRLAKPLQTAIYCNKYLCRRDNLQRCYISIINSLILKHYEKDKQQQRNKRESNV